MDQTYKRFLQKLQQKMLKLGILPQREKILVACSGGLDSTALVHALIACDFKIQVAHVNYKLRSEESDANEHFVSGLCSSLNITFHVNSFETKSLLDSNKGNLQEVARELRYKWFEELMKLHDLDFIATAHHSDDQAETLIHHFIRGSALKGLSGIADKRDRIIRPFLDFSREEIFNISELQKWEHSRDSSNEKNDYTRNFIRNQIMPLVREINPNVSETLSKQAELYQEMNAFLKYSANNFIKDLILKRDEFSSDLDIAKLISVPGYIVILYEFLRDSGFTNDQIQQIASAIDAKESGLVLTNKTYKLLVDRQTLKVSVHHSEESNTPLIWESASDSISLPDGSILKRSLEEPEHIPVINKINVGIQVVKQTLYLRHWKSGDVFFPKGMNGHSKKISDYFIDSKVNRFDKDAAWLLVNDKDEIIWIISMRADHRFIPVSSEESTWIYLENKDLNY
ncbi:MAG: tRNA lysidine(34) synthetase TilS [Saprospiraceae bacterium]|nr:tRNA lysidine(34) synthetase TilS [Saprospiraceae bacterium]